MKKLLVGLTLAGSLLIGGISPVFAASVSQNGISANPTNDYIYWWSQDPTVAVKNNNTWPVTITATLEYNDYGTDWMSTSIPQTITLNPGEKEYIKVDGGGIKAVQNQVNEYEFKIDSVKYDGKSLGSFYTSTIYGNDFRAHKE